MKGIEAKHKPTEVHLQVFDGVAHDLTLFSMTKPARGAYRSIATFCRYVTPSNPGGLRSDETTPTGTPGTQTPGRTMRQTVITDSVTFDGAKTPRGRGADGSDAPPPPVVADEATRITSKPLVETPQSGLSQEASDEAGEMPSPEAITERLRNVKVEEKRQDSRFTRMSTRLWPSSTEDSFDSCGERKRRDRSERYKPGTCGWPGIYAGPDVSFLWHSCELTEQPFSDGNMIRQRVDFNGNVRPLEPADQLQACTMPLAETGMIKEGPAMRYIEGQAKWDRKFHRVKKRVARHRKRNLKKARGRDADQIARNWDTVGESIKASMPGESEHPADHGRHGPSHDADHGADSENEGGPSSSSSSSSEDNYGDGDDMDMLGVTWGWALNGEAPPPSAIVSRRDLVS